MTGVGLPLISIAALGYSGCLDLEEAAGRVHPWYGVFYSVVSYLAIGPCFAAPRTGTVSFEIAVKPFLGSFSPDIALPIFLLVFFLLTYWLAATPSKLVDRVGKILTPALLAVILLLIVQSFISPLGTPQAPTKNYATPVTAVMQGILDGYNTLDAIASFIFATLVEASDEAGHEGDIDLKLLTIENLDKRAVGPIYEAVKDWDEPVAIAVLPDHPTPCELRTHTSDPIPFLIWYPGIEPDEVQTYDEISACDGSYGVLKEDEFIKEFMNQKNIQ